MTSPEPAKHRTHPEFPALSSGAIAIVLALYAVLVLLRLPQVALHGRFWAEEGTVFFAHAWTRPPLDALLYSYGGYLNLAANAATLLARYTLPLEAAPYLTVATGLLFQLLPPLLLLLARDPWLQNPRIRATALLLLLFVPATDEIWLQSLHCQFELTLAGALALALDAPHGRRAAIPLAALALGPLCGPGAIVLLPLFALRLAIDRLAIDRLAIDRLALDRSRARATQTSALLAATALQLAVFYHPLAARPLAIDPAALLTVAAVKHLVVPFLGIHAAMATTPRWQAALAAGTPPILALAAALAAVALLATALARTRNAPGAWLLAAAALVGAASYVGALDGDRALVSPFIGERYAFVPQSLIALALLSLATRPPPACRVPACRVPAYRVPAVRAVAALLCAWLLVVGVQQYRRPVAIAAHGPDWRAEVAAWRADPAHPLRLWPSPWTMTLESATP